MRFAALLSTLVVFAGGSGLACDAEPGTSMDGGGYTTAVEGLHAKCEPHEGLLSFSVLTDGGHGAVSGFIGLCKDGTGIAVND